MTIASIDIGTNTILLLIAKLNLSDKTINVILEDQKIPRIGEGLKPGGKILAGKVDLLLDILASYRNLADKYGCNKILLTATNAFRIASNKKDLIEKIKDHLNLEVNVVSGLDEAKLTFLGCTHDNSTSESFTVIDIGGGSTEIIFGSRDNIFSICSLPLGVVALTEKYFSNDPPDNSEIDNVKTIIRDQLKNSIKEFSKFQTTIAVAGTPTTLACIKKGLKRYDESLIEGEILTQDELAIFLNQLSKMNSLGIKNKFGSIVEGRHDVLLAGTILLNEILHYIQADEVVVSTRGLRYGAIYQHLNEADQSSIF